MSATRGRLRVYLGMAPGVGKTYAMLEEAQRSRARGQDVVVGFVETYGRPATEALLDGLESVPRRRIEYRGVTVEEMDADAILDRAPAVALIDELAHTNAPGSLREKRWEDVEAIRDARIDVISTCNVQHVTSVAGGVETLTGAPVHERVPDEIVRGADEIELVDLSPGRLRGRIRRGEVYPADRIEIALARFFTEPNLTALRDLALHFVTNQVDTELVDRLAAGLETGTGATGARVMIVLDDSDASRRVLRRGALLATRLRAPILVLILIPSSSGGARPAAAGIDEMTAEAADAGAEVVRLTTDDPAATIARAARDRSVTHLVLGQPHRTRLARLVGDPFLDRILLLAPDLEISLVGPGRPEEEARRATF